MPQGQHRGPGALKTQRVALEKPKTGKGRGGTKGKDTRSGTKRSRLEKVAYDFDFSGFQEKVLKIAFTTFCHGSHRASICAAGARHENGLVLSRPPRASCSSTACSCAANTKAIAARILSPPKKVRAALAASLPPARARVTMDAWLTSALPRPCSCRLTQVSRWWSQQMRTNPMAKAAFEETDELDESDDDDSSDESCSDEEVDGQEDKGQS